MLSRMWSHNFSWKHFLVRNSLLQVPTSTQAKRWSFDVINWVKGQFACNFQTRNTFLEKVMWSNYQLSSKYNFCMRRSFKFQVWVCQNVSVETWIRAAKIWLKNFEPFWKYKQHADWISIMWNICAKWNARSLTYWWRVVLRPQRLGKIPYLLALQLLVSTKRSYILKQTCSWKLKVCLSMYDLSVGTRR